MTPPNFGGDYTRRMQEHVMPDDESAFAAEIVELCHHYDDRHARVLALVQRRDRQLQRTHLLAAAEVNTERAMLLRARAEDIPKGDTVFEIALAGALYGALQLEDVAKLLRAIAMEVKP